MIRRGAVGRPLEAVIALSFFAAAALKLISIEETSARLVSVVGARVPAVDFYAAVVLMSATEITFSVLLVVGVAPNLCLVSLVVPVAAYDAWIVWACAAGRAITGCPCFGRFVARETTCGTELLRVNAVLVVLVFAMWLRRGTRYRVVASTP